MAGPDLIILLLIILVLFGAKRLPELAREMGQAMKEFHKAKDELTSELHHADKPAANPNVTAASGNVPRRATTSPPPPTRAEVHPEANRRVE